MYGNKDSIDSRVNFANNILKDDFDNLINIQFENNNIGNITKLLKNKRTYDLNEIFGKIKCKLILTNITKKNIYFKGIINNEKTFNLKMSLCEKKNEYNIKRSENNEIIMSILLSKLVIKKKTPHIVLPIATFYTNINNFLKIPSKQIKDKKKYNEFLNEYSNNNYSKKCSIIINEYSNLGTLVDFIKINFDTITLRMWRVIFFQIISLLSVLQSEYPTFRHNEFSPKILMVNKIQKTDGKYSYKVCHNGYIIDNIGYMIKLCDFDYAYIQNIIDNPKIINIENNRYYDLHYFFCALISRDCCPEILTSSDTATQIKEFINRIIPYKYRRQMPNHEYLIPNDILMNDQLFGDFRESYLKNTHTEIYAKINELINKTKNNYSIYHNISPDIYGVLYKQQTKLRQICYIYWCIKNIIDNNLWLPQDVFMEILQFVFIKIIDE